MKNESNECCTSTSSPRRTWIPELAAVALLGAYALSLDSQEATTAQATEVRCTALELVDAQGRVVASLGTDEDGYPFLRLKKGGMHASLALSSDSTGLASGSAHGVSYVGVTNRGPYVNFRGSNLRNGIWAGVNLDGSAGFRAYGETLKVGVQLEVDAQGDPVLRLADPKGKSLYKKP